MLSININGVCMVFWQARFKIQSISGLVRVILARIQSINGLYKCFFFTIHSWTIQWFLPMYRYAIHMHWWTVLHNFFCQIRGKITPLNANEVNLFYLYFPIFYFTWTVTSFLIFSSITKKITIYQSFSGLIFWEGADSWDGSNSHLKICCVFSIFSKQCW